MGENVWGIIHERGSHPRSNRPEWAGGYPYVHVKVRMCGALASGRRYRLPRYVASSYMPLLPGKFSHLLYGCPFARFFRPVIQLAFLRGFPPAPSGFGRPRTALYCTFDPILTPTGPGESRRGHLHAHGGQWVPGSMECQYGPPMSHVGTSYAHRPKGAGSHLTWAGPHADT